MEAKKAREIAEEIQRSGVNEILPLIEMQARRGQFGLSLTDHMKVKMNNESRKVLQEMGYKVEWQNTQRDDGYWQINW